uniref:Uncharacterized protein n=1 Tax=Fibrocapsa japonica TaxID=94617 RepID=A0A7S2USE1_9STRA|mmetsp:Transcript_11007/g.16209  ORF Transcript_11007/g.16209 Transcript_11007/m.16209 type:complete len:264 (+) Transcript_11007:34-825(+)
MKSLNMGMKKCALLLLLNIFGVIGGDDGCVCDVPGDCSTARPFRAIQKGEDCCECLLPGEPGTCRDSCFRLGSCELIHCVPENYDNVCAFTREECMKRSSAGTKNYDQGVPNSPQQYSNNPYGGGQGGRANDFSYNRPVNDYSNNRPPNDYSNNRPNSFPPNDYSNKQYQQKYANPQQESNVQQDALNAIPGQDIEVPPDASGSPSNFYLLVAFFAVVICYCSLRRYKRLRHNMFRTLYSYESIPEYSKLNSKIPPYSDAVKL